MRGWLAIVLLCAIGSSSLADERAEARRLAPKYAAQPEVRMTDGTVCDLVSETEAIEIDYAPKWAEAVGQSLHYAEMTGKKAGIILLLEDPDSEWRHLVRCARLCGKLGIQLYVEELSREQPPVQPKTQPDSVADAQPRVEGTPVGFKGLSADQLQGESMSRSWLGQPKQQPAPKAEPKTTPAKPIVKQQPIRYVAPSSPQYYYSRPYSSPGYCPPGAGST